MARGSKYSPKIRERAVRLARGSDRAISAVARDLGMPPKTLRTWVRQDEADDGSRTDRLATVEREELTALRREVRDLHRANEILKAASMFRTGARPTPSEVSTFIDQHCARLGVEPICRELEVSASAYWQGGQDHRRFGRFVMQSFSVRSAVFTPSRLRSTGNGRCGSSFSARGTPWRVARWSV